MMETDPTEKTDKPKTSGFVKIEWNWDFDDLRHEMKSIKVEIVSTHWERKVASGLKGRCRRCWGGLIGKGGAEHIPTAIRCRVCGILLEGSDARGRVPTDVRSEHVEHAQHGLRLPPQVQR